MSDVSLLGTGLFGTPIALRLAATGLEVTVWNRTAAKSEPLGEAVLAEGLVTPLPEPASRL